jgi:hypothetical protein
VLGLVRRRLLAGLVVILTTLGILALSLAYLIPAPPTTVTIATAFKGASYDYYGHRYRDRFALAHVKLDVSLGLEPPLHVGSGCFIGPTPIRCHLRLAPTTIAI